MPNEPELDLQSIREAMASLQSASTAESEPETKRIGRPKGSSNKPKVEPAQANHIAFIQELEDLIGTWAIGEQRPILYDFEAATVIKELMAKHGL